MLHNFSNRTWASSLLAPLLIFPWINPYTAGPSPNVWPWLVSALCALLLWLFGRDLSPRLVAIGWVAAACLSAVIALVQYFGLASHFTPWMSVTKAGEAFGNLRQRNQLATLLSIGLVALIGLMAMWEQTPASLSSANMRRRLWGWALLAACLLALGNAASGSRTGLLQWLAIPVLTAWWQWPRRRLALFAALALLMYGAAIFALPWLLELFTGLRTGGLLGRLTDAPTCESRKILWSNVLTLIAQKPWLGWGWGGLEYAHFMTLFPGPRFCDILDNAHNLPLHLAVELGIPAALALCGLMGWLVMRARPWAEADPARQMAWGVLAVIGLHSLVEYPLWYGPFQIAAALCVVLLWLRELPAAEFSRQFIRKRPVDQLIRALLAMVIIASLLAVAISYYRVSQIYLVPAERGAAYQEDTLMKIRGSTLFAHQAQFAELSVTPLTPETAAQVYRFALELLHYSPEPRVIEKLIESSVMLGREDEALYYLARYRAAFAQDHAKWASKNAQP